MNVIKKYFNTAPFLLPIIGLFLLALTAIEVKNFWMDGVAYSGSYMLIPAWALLYTAFWMGTVYLRKWGLYGFVGMTALSWLITLAAPENEYVVHVLSLWQTPIPLNIILSMLLLLFFKKFRVAPEVIDKIKQ